ncbi:hypothetical protein TAGGR_1498 [Thermodesulfovibrio aggregans]|uniref:Rod shape-determining protein MreD n=1 Tax=Thermodesulfovibrio aggregans TaxID=86166 RepID=A0A0U9HV76_9BACT|nr:hypothetical protein [Thermodesulfovibrio aggregans]GAQ94319.1 hypothetical protein TAGGR_1498 [Thermodesulfovibrio aggregans]
MRHLTKWSVLIFSAFFIEQIFTIGNISFNFSFLLIYLFVIDYFFPEVEQKKIAPSEVLPVLFFVMIGLIEDFFQGIIGPAVISKTITGVLLIVLVRQLFFHWTEIFKALVIFVFTIIDEIISSLIMIYFFDFSFNTQLFKAVFLRGLINIPIGLILSRRKP